MHIGLLFGSFNPVHIGHLIIAHTMIELVNLDKVWLVVTPKSPFKFSEELLDAQERLTMVQMAIADNPKMELCDIEFSMPKPHYTINTLKKLQQMYPDITFSLIIGEDNLVNFDKWEGYKDILTNFEVYVYPRPYTQDAKLKGHPKVHFLNCPLLDISASYIREFIRAGNSIRYLVPPQVDEYIRLKLISKFK
ncbi:MAG: nicotinate (nicotinamide) nucleotide adenylyltransferase [Cytophagales bacterium]|nr:nicotinate (nicotinamide) nucleotide adenylyltransferase [Cytophagales bacterium]